LRDARIALGLQAVRAGFAKDGAWIWAKPGARAEEQADAEAKQEQSLAVPEVSQEPPADRAPEQQLRPEHGPAPGDSAMPATGANPETAAAVASPPLQPAPAYNREPANQRGETVRSGIGEGASVTGDRPGDFDKF
jgi:hypothetical protein